MSIGKRKVASALILVLCGGWAQLGVGASSHKDSTPVVVVRENGQPPSDAVILFDGSNASQFTQLDGTPAGWRVEEGVLITGEQDIVSRYRFSDAQFHVEFNLPADDPKHGNSGLYFHHLYELQILDSHNPNQFAPNQQCASIFSTYAPLANVTRPPGEWQTYDIIFHGARLDESGKVAKPARFTVFHNGVLVQHERWLSQGTGQGRKNPMVSEGPVKLQAHGSPVRFRNIWARSLK